MGNTASAKYVRRLLGGAIPRDAVDGLEERLEDLQAEIDQVEAGEVTAIHGGTP